MYYIYIYIYIYTSLSLYIYICITAQTRTLYIYIYHMIYIYINKTGKGERGHSLCIKHEVHICPLIAWYQASVQKRGLAKAPRTDHPAEPEYMSICTHMYTCMYTFIYVVCVWTFVLYNGKICIYIYRERACFLCLTQTWSSHAPGYCILPGICPEGVPCPGLSDRSSSTARIQFQGIAASGRPSRPQRATVAIQRVLSVR